MANRAYDQPALTIPAELTAHSRKMEQKVYRVTGNYYLALGYGLGSTHMIVGDKGVILIDPIECVEKCREINRAFREITDKPVKAVIYTHMHVDHFWGVKGFVSEEEVLSGRCAVIAHETMVQNFVLSAANGPGIYNMVRSDYSFGNYLELGPEGRVNNGIGPDVLVKKTSFIPPTMTVKDQLDLEIAGVNMHIFWVPSECDDEIAVWFPDMKVLCSAEVIQGEAFPNLHTLRGTRYRDPRQWYKSIDLLRRFDAEYLAPSHGRPVYGRENIADVLRAYRDAIQFVHNQTIRLMNEGYTADELVGLIRLPDHLARHPWLGEFYGTVKHAVREIYQGEIGWFSGDPTTLDPIPPLESAARHLKLMGGRDPLVAEAKKALETGDYQWAAELTTYVIRVDKNDKEARGVKAEALRQLGYRTINTNWRCWYLSSARELEGVGLDYTGRLHGGEMIRALPVAVILEAMGLRLIPEKALPVHLTVGFCFPDLKEAYALEIRMGVAEFHQKYPDKVDAAVTMDHTLLLDIITGVTSIKEGLESGALSLDGDISHLAGFFACFGKPKRPEDIQLTLR